MGRYVIEEEPQQQERYVIEEPTQAEQVHQNDIDVIGGLVRGAGSIGSTILYPYDRFKGGSRDEGLRLNRERRGAIDAALQQLIGANPESTGYQTGKLGAEVLGTAGVGNVFANGVRALPMINRAIPGLAPALESGGFRIGQTSATPLGMVGNAATRTAAGGVVGGTMAGMVNPEEAQTGAVIGAAMPGAFKLAGDAGMAVNRAGKAASRRLMQSAIKPTIKQLKTGDARIAVDTLLDYGINPNRRGVEKLRASVDDINAEIANRLNNSAATVSRDKVVQYLDDVRGKFGNQVSPTSDISAINGVADDFMNHPGIVGNDIPVQQAQRLKTGTYKTLAGKYGEAGSAATEAQKALARGLKDEISAAVPGVGALNAEEARLLKTLGVAERRALMELNKNPVGLSALASNPSMFALFLADRSAAFKGIAARMVNRASSAPAALAPIGEQFSNPLLRGGLLAIEANP